MQNREIHALKDKVKETIDLVKQQDLAIDDLKSDYENNLERNESRERELNEAKAVRDKLLTDQRRLVERVGEGK